MTDVWLFGTFYCTNRLQTENTRDYKATKWRSQIKVPQGSVVQGSFQSGQANTVRVGTSSTSTVSAVYLTDLEYQLRDISPKGNDRILTFTSLSTRGVYPNYYWFRSGEKTEYQPAVYSPNNPDPNNPDPNSPNSNNPNAAAFVKPIATPKPLIELGYLNFVEERLELGYDYGAVGGMAFQTEIVEVASDKEQRNALRYLPLGRWQLGDRSLLESDVDQINEVGYLKDFHRDRQGSYQGFRFKDWSDYQAFDQLIGFGDGVKTQFQLQKAYTVGNAVVYRPILKPLYETLSTEISFLPIGSTVTFSLDIQTGIVTFDDPLPDGAEFKASFEFDVPVWFESDQIGFKLNGYAEETNEAAVAFGYEGSHPKRTAIYQLESVFVVEGRIPVKDAFASSIEQIDQPLDLGIIYETIEQMEFSTVKLELKSGYIKRESKRLESRTIFNLGSRNYDRGEIDQILSYFWLAKGSLMPFPFRNLDLTYTARFATDQLNLKFEGADETEQIFSLSGLKLQVVPAKGLIKYLDKDTYVYFCIDESGSIDDSLPAIYQAIYDWQQILQVYIYGDDVYNKTQTVTYTDGAWLYLPSLYFQTKAVYLIFSAEAAPIYHSTQTFTPYTPAWNTDRDSFTSTFDDRDFCKIIVNAIAEPSAPNDIFSGQLFAAQEGLLGYSPPLKDYGLEIVLNINPATNSYDWLDYFRTGLISNNFEA
jgi:uncharacterized protein (TIGR02217 family)